MFPFHVQPAVSFLEMNVLFKGDTLYFIFNHNS